MISSEHEMSGKSVFLWKELIVFYILSLFLSFPVLLLWKPSADFKPGDVEAFEKSFGDIPMLYSLGPLLAAILVTIIYRKKNDLFFLFKRIVRWRFSFVWYLMALLLPIIPQWVSLFIWARLADTTLALPDFTAYFFSWLQITAVSTVFFITEELGWRGFMLPRILSLQPWIKASITVGVFWAIWHYPLWYVSGWATSGSWTHASIMVAASSVFAIGLSILITWIFTNARGSVLIAMLFHGSNNTSRKLIYEVAGDKAMSGYSFSVVSAITTITFALLIYLFIIIMRKRKKEKYDNIVYS